MENCLERAARIISPIRRNHFIGMLLITIFSPVQSYAIEVSACAGQFKSYGDTAEAIFLAEDVEKHKTEIISADAINFDFINSFTPNELDDISENARVYAETAANQQPDDDPDVERFHKARDALISCWYEKKMAELSRIGRDTGDPAGPSSQETSLTPSDPMPVYGPLPKVFMKKGEECLVVDNFERRRINGENDRIKDVINFIVRNECKQDLVYYMEFSDGIFSSWDMTFGLSKITNGNFSAHAGFINKAFERDWRAAGEHPDRHFLGWDWRYLTKPPANISPLTQSSVAELKRGQSYAMEFYVGGGKDSEDSEWPPVAYIIGACAKSESNRGVDMVFNANSGAFACLPVVDD